MKKIVVIIVLCLAVALHLSMRYGLEQRSERKRLERNQQTLLEQQNEYKVRDSLNAISIRMLTLRMDEFKNNFGEVDALVRDMGLRVRRIENVSQNATQSDYELTAPVVDTVIRHSDTTSIATAQAIRYASPHITFDGVILNSVFHGKITTYDTLTQIVHRVPRRFLFIKYGTKELRQEIISSNPHSRITYSRVVELKRGRR